jgi:hypothetical protein
MNEPRKLPFIEGAVGLVWKPRKYGWMCVWQARTDLIEKGWLPKTIRLWGGNEADLTPAIAGYIKDRSRYYQDDMLAWSRGFQPQLLVGEVKTWGDLCQAYQTDPDSKYVKPGGLRYKTREFYKILMGKIETEYGNVLISETKARNFLRWHEVWTHNENGPPKVTAAASGITMCRILTNFGATILESAACKEAADTLSRMQFKSPKPRESFLEVEQIDAIREKAHELGFPSVALAQAFQFECVFRQKDCIGAWEPISEPGVSDVLDGQMKWLRGIRWEEIDQQMILRHITSKRQKLIEVPLLEAPMIVAELTRIFGTTERTKLPTSGPIIIDHRFGIPWLEWRFRSKWREIATACGIPKSIKNMDSRAGAITEATEAGAPVEHVKHAAGHSQTQQTEKYSRNQAKKGASVLNIRAASRQNKSGT